jgi:hypothetical protein
MNTNLGHEDVIVGNYAVGTALKFAVTEKPGWLVEGF